MCGVAIALVGSSRRRLPEAPPVFVVVSALLLAGLALVGNLAVAAIVVGVAGAACMLAEISALGRLQRCVAAHDLAPAFGVLDSVSVLAMLAGAAIAPAAIATIGARPALLLTGTAVASVPLLTRTDAASTLRILRDQPPLEVRFVASQVR